jgi:putative membrane protein insertion efficiency factor|tara:strand:- start:118 stop:384 length:267 start_codon:yes stop_codon:yes gene_type:complete
MLKLIISLNIGLIKMYKYLLSPMLGNKCRYSLTCSEYYIDSLKLHGLTKGSYLGIKRILSCHPFKFLGGGSGLDFVPKKKITKDEYHG